MTIQSLRFQKNERGQTTPFLLLAMVTLLAFTFFSIHYGFKKHEQIRLQIAADAAVTSGALWQARTYNAVAALNQGILIALTVALSALLIIAALTICTATIVGSAFCGSMLATLKDPLINIATNSWDIAVEMSKMERIIIKVAPLPVLAYTLLVAKENQAEIVIPFPFQPEILGGKHGKKTTLSFHTKDGGFESLIEKALEEIMGKTSGFSAKVLEKALSMVDDILAKAGDMPDPLVLDEDFRPNMKLGVMLQKQYTGEKSGLVAYSQASPFLPDIPYGEEDLYEMNWRAQLRPSDFYQDFMGSQGTLEKIIKMVFSKL